MAKKPKIQFCLAFDGGWPYPHWICSGFGVQGTGVNPKEAYVRWLMRYGSSGKTRA